MPLPEHIRLELVVLNVELKAISLKLNALYDGIESELQCGESCDGSCGSGVDIFGDACDYVGDAVYRLEHCIDPVAHEAAEAEALQRFNNPETA